MQILEIDIQMVEKLIVYSTIIFIISASSSAFLMPKVNNLGFKFNIIDKPDIRKQHKKLIVRLGGLGIYIGFLIGIIVLLIIRFPTDIGKLIICLTSSPETNHKSHGNIGTPLLK